MMLKLTLKSLLSRKLRLVLSGLAVVLAVMFVSGSMVIKDTLNRSIDAQFTGAYEDIDLHVALKPKVKSTASDDITVVPPLDRATVDRVAKLPGVAGTSGLVRAEGARVIGKDGKVVPGTGGPRYGESWRGESELISLRSGHEPTSDTEVAVNAGLAEKAGLEVGDKVGVLTNEPRRTFVVAGVFGFSGDRDSISGEQTVAFTEPVAQRLMLGTTGGYSGVKVTLAADASAAAVQSALARELGARYDVLTGSQLAERESDEARDILDMMGMVLLGFAGVAVFVGIFLIINTFSIIIAQRMRELALLRALGASRKQVIGSVLLESFAVGLVSSTLGLAAGIGIGALGADLLASSTDGLEVAGLSVPTSAVVVSFTVGIVVTMLAALVPALRASKVAPIAVIRAAATPQDRHRKQTWAGTALLGIGLVLLALGLFGSGGAAPLITGILLAFVGISLLTPLISKPSVEVLGALFARATPGALGRRNSARNPRRTAITASAMMIGVALVTAISTVAASAEDSVNRGINRDLKADLVAMGDAGSAASATIDPAALNRIAEAPGVQNVAAATLDMATVGKENQPVAAWQDWSKAREVLGLKKAEGNLDTLAPGTVVMNENTAERRGLKTGDRVTLQFQRGDARAYRVAGVFQDTTLSSGIVVPWADAEADFRSKQPSQAYFQLAAGADESKARAQIAALLKDSPEVTVRTRADVIEMFGGAFDTVLTVVQGLLGVAMLIAVLGIVNTLALSILERTKEMGMLRAIGLTRGQTVRMIMTESVVISLFGAVLGIMVGGLLGLAAARALEDQGVSALALPWGQLLAYLIGAGVVGVIASLAPARRGARLNVLTAISHG
ncbi:ABC transporter [Streptomyces poonensis]|uniref:ABC transporter n=2 Tax=Streptomyces poonensis TaxID=68255 RepID=A0A918UQ46_9ACTN|nr:ABC transporter [Streptomyces poonensis]